MRRTLVASQASLVAQGGTWAMEYSGQPTDLEAAITKKCLDKLRPSLGKMIDAIRLKTCAQAHSSAPDARLRQRGGGGRGVPGVRECG